MDHHVQQRGRGHFFKTYTHAVNWMQHTSYKYKKKMLLQSYWDLIGENEAGIDWVILSELRFIISVDISLRFLASSCLWADCDWSPSLDLLNYSKFIHKVIFRCAIKFLRARCVDVVVQLHCRGGFTDHHFLTKLVMWQGHSGRRLSSGRAPYLNCFSQGGVVHCVLRWFRQIGLFYGVEKDGQAQIAFTWDT